MNPALQVRAATVDDVAAVARLHCAAFPASSLTGLGEEAVRRNYLSQLTGPHDVSAFVAEQDGRIAGFLVGGVFRGSLSGFLRANRWFLVGALARRPGLLLNRQTVARARLAVRLLAKGRAQPAAEVPENVPENSFGILAIAVDPELQGTGVGRALLGAAEAAARTAGFERMHLTVDETNTEALRFYWRGGWEKMLTTTGGWNGLITRDVDATSLPDPD